MNTLLSTAGRAGTQAQRIATADWAPALEATARTIAALAVACFVAGEALGRWVHQTSALLGRAHACLLAGHQQAQAIAEPALEAVAEAIDLAGLTVIELRGIARERLGSAARLEGRRIAQAKRSALLAALA